MGSPTTNFGWIKPTVSGDTDIWGDELNLDLTDIDSLTRRSINNFIFATAPAEAQAGTIWLDNTSNPYVLKIYDGADWIIIGYMNTSTNTFDTATTSNYVGDMKFSAQTASHGSWLLCNGASVSTTTYSGLFALVGYAFGGSGANFTLPDLRGRAPGAIGAGSGLTTRALGDTVGAETVTLSSAQIPAHTHNIIEVATGVHLTASVGASLNGSTGIPYANSGGSGDAFIATNNTGGGGSHNNMQPTLFIGNYFIYSGV
jgi:microcystin-dependent protein